MEALGDLEESERALLAAVEIARLADPVDPVACLLYADLIRLRNQRGADTQALLTEARSAFPENCVLLWIEARQLTERAEYAGAIKLLDLILNVDWARQPDAGPAYDQEMVWELPWSAKALCLFRIGAYDKAAEAYAALARGAPADPSYPIKAKLALARARQAEAAR